MGPGHHSVVRREPVQSRRSVCPPHHRPPPPLLRPRQLARLHKEPAVNRKRKDSNPSPASDAQRTPSTNKASSVSCCGCISGWNVTSISPECRTAFIKLRRSDWTLSNMAARLSQRFHRGGANWAYFTLWLKALTTPDDKPRGPNCGTAGRSALFSDPSSMQRPGR